jgi:3-hydroxyisobutyrate dehydrogenase-like beta-hydroxyacid dehydrogenase
MTMTTIGFVGLGAMGAPLAGRLLQGNQVYGTNRTKVKASPLIDRGLIWRDTPREVAAAAQVVLHRDIASFFQVLAAAEPAPAARAGQQGRPAADDGPRAA